jgi:hypothetical protein
LPSKWEIMCFVKQLPQRLVYCEKKSKSCGSVIKIPQLVVLSETISSRREWYSPAKKREWFHEY